MLQRPARAAALAARAPAAAFARRCCWHSSKTQFVARPLPIPWQLGH
jgi:hypothetical protein